MMDTRVYTLLVFCVSIAIANGSSVENVAEYIDEKFRSSQVKIVRKYIGNIAKSSIYSAQWKNLWSKELKSDHHNLPLDTFNNIFVLTKGDNIISMRVRVNSKKRMSNNIVGFYRDYLIKHTRSVIFIKSIVWNNWLCLLICYEGNVCSVYTSESDLNLYLRQNITSDGLSVDASFVIKNNHLILVIAKNRGAHPAVSVIYLWTGTSMALITEVTMSSVQSVTTFDSNRGSIVIIFGRNGDKQSNIGFEVYELFIPDENTPGRIERIKFLSTPRPVSIHHYMFHGLDFLLVIDETEPARGFWWDRNEFLPWHQINYIWGYDIMLKNIYIDDDSFILIAKTNILSLYKITSESFDHLSNVKIENILKIVDFRVWSDFMGNIFLVSITERMENSFGVESWHVILNTKMQIEGLTMNKAHITIVSCLSRLQERLNKRMQSIEKIYKSWELFSSSNISNFISPTILNNQSITSEKELTESVKTLDKQIDNILIKTRKLIQRKGNETPLGTLVFPSLIIDGDVRFQSLKTPSLHTESINDVAINDIIPNNLFSNDTQYFSEALRGRHVTIHHLRVKSLCSVPEEHWLLTTDPSRSPLKPVNKGINQSLFHIIGNTVRIRTNVNFQNIRVATLNSVDVYNIIDDLFIIGHRQIINGNLCYHSMLSIDNLILFGHLNGVSKNNLMTLTTDQNFTMPIKIDSLNVFHLLVNKINGVPVKDAVRVSQDNIIHSKIIVNNLKIKDELLVADPTAFANEHQIYIFDDVEFVGNVTIDRLIVKSQADIIFGEDNKVRGHDVNDLFVNSWSKSTDQVISSPLVNFRRGLTIDQLNTNYFNGLQEHEYLYTTVKNLPAQFVKIHFANLFVQGSIYRGEKFNSRLFQISNDSVIINWPIHIPYLTVQQLYTNRYNSMAIDVIISNKMNKDQSHLLVFPRGMKLPNLIVNEWLDVSHLQYQTLNQHKMPENWINNNEKTDIRNGAPTNKLFPSVFDTLASFYSMSNDFLEASELNIIIEGELIIDEELTVNNSINNEEVNHHIDRLAKSDIHIINQLFIDDLIVIHDLSIEFLHNINFNEFVLSIFSKSKNQEFDSRLKIFHRVTLKNLRAMKINNFSQDELQYTNDTLIFERNVTFTSLSANIETENFNGINISTKFLEDYSTLIQSMTKVNSLRVNGNVSWKENQSNPSISSLENFSSLLQNAITLEDEQTINTPIIFSSNNSNVNIDTFASTNPLDPNIVKIIEDSTMNTSNSTILITGNKNFQTSVIINDLNVNENVAIAQLDTMTINELNDSLVRKFDNETTIEDDCTIIGESLYISHLVVNNLGPHLPNISALFVISDDNMNTLPINTHFNEVIVRGNATVEYFDDISFDKFMSERVSTRGNHMIYSNVQFTKPVRVSGDTLVQNGINDVAVEDLVINGTIQRQIIESGQSAFFEDLTVEGEMNVHFINDIDVIQTYEDGVFNNKPAVIESDLIIGNKVKTSSPLTVTGTVNDFKMSEFIKYWNTTADKYLQEIIGNSTIVSEWINKSIDIETYQQNLPQLFDHLEFDENLSVVNIQNASKIVPIIMSNNFIEFNIYGVQLGKYCAGLPDDCLCRTQYIVEIKNANSETKRVENGRWIIYNYRNPDGRFEIYVKTNTISSSPRCSLQKDQSVDEYSIISLKILDQKDDSLNFEYPVKINGYLNDAKIFINNGSAYIVLAIGYNAHHETYQTNSFIYKLNLETNELALNLIISMTAAAIIEVFEIGNNNIHVIICSSTGDSILYRLDPTIDEFIFIRSFTAVGGTVRHVKSLRCVNDQFLFIDDVPSNAIHIYYYNKMFDNFYFYQSLYLQSPVSSIETFHIGTEFNYNDAFVVVTTEMGDLLLYEYMIYEKFQLKIKKQMNGLLAAAPFHLSHYQYLLLIGRESSTVLRIVEHGSL